MFHFIIFVLYYSAKIVKESKNSFKKNGICFLSYNNYICKDMKTIKVKRI